MTLPRRKRVRMVGFDYSTAGGYFITINTRIRRPWFGLVSGGVMRLNSAGQMVLAKWDSIPARHPGIMLDAVVIMPDHLHGILVLGTNPDITDTPSLSDVVGTFKSLTTLAYGRGVREDGWPPFEKHLWHRSFRDTIIRTDRALDAFRAYIDGNPGRWSEKHGR